jgi:tRNA(fMet)-specific endonuclease VapC
MMYLPDTNVWIQFLNPDNNRVKDRMLSVESSAIQLCSVVKAELFFGAEKSNRKSENHEVLRNLFADVASVPFDDDAARKYGEIRAELSRAGTPIGPNDLMIAAIALVNGSILVTHNTREFSRIKDLKLEDWEA